jgi:hypothetical protein
MSRPAESSPSASLATAASPSGSASSIDQPLLTPRSIRVLAIEPGTFRQTIHCSLKLVQLDEAGSLPYEALSYVWGPPTPAVPIVCNEIQMNVTPNLGAALQRLRYSDLTRILWVNAICINQKDLDERAQQVSIMGDVYEFTY